MIRQRALLLLLICVLGFAAVVAGYLLHAIRSDVERALPASPSLISPPSVAVLHVAAARHKARVKGYGEVRSRDALTLVAQVSDQMSELAKDFETGHEVAQATLLARQEALGSYDQAGSEIAAFYRIDRVEVAVPLSPSAWGKLPNDLALTEARWPVELIEVETGERWLGYVQRIECQLDETRERSLIVAIDRPLERSLDLLPGTFVEVNLTGRSMPGVWKIPAASLSQHGEVWYVHKDGTLDSFAAQVLFVDEEAIYVSVPEHLVDAPQQVIMRPLNSYRPGMTVNALEVGADAFNG
ncbi:hypothetical protein [Billgrantia montanilacus]|uniref:HlyD family secretion protein n=1 Tax=Billgrantia montanilacus TaxID=2282305 RepID=A0A368TVH8_9GAMM|nr:hypothetical protein [Halomonas montanilacus]RCV88809.1 hypothetical protein DU505_11900 [Halomonas montanilacus]